MAKGNDGNYLQHSVEVSAAKHLAARNSEGYLHIALAHGMAPFETKASLIHYPNTAELLRCVIGPERLSGGIAEVDRQKHAELRAVWAGYCVVPVHSSWRAGVLSGGVLTSPDRLNTPWLFTMDPMTYCEGGRADDNNLRRADFGRLSAALKSFVVSGQAGVAAIFVYAVKPHVQPSFWTFMDDLARKKPG